MSQPTVVLSNLAIVVEDRLVVEATDLHYNIQTTNLDTRVGREMIGLMPVPAPQLPAINYTNSGGTLAVEASNWITAASNALNQVSRATSYNELTVNSTLEALLFERAVAMGFGARGVTWWTNHRVLPLPPQRCRPHQPGGGGSAGFGADHQQSAWLSAPIHVRHHQ